MTIGRGYGIRCWLYLQNINQLKERYEAGWNTMLGNCDVWQIFGANDYFSATELAGVTGLPAANFLRLQADEQYLVIKGLIQKASKLDYLIDSQFDGHFDENPYYRKVNRQKRREESK